MNPPHPPPPPHANFDHSLQRNYNGDWLGDIFSQAVFMGNGLAAIVSGLVAHSLVDTLQLGPVAPFDAAAVGMWGGRGEPFVHGGQGLAVVWPGHRNDGAAFFFFF